MKNLLTSYFIAANNNVVAIKVLALIVELDGISKITPQRLQSVTGLRKHPPPLHFFV